MNPYDCESPYGVGKRTKRDMNRWCCEILVIILRPELAFTRQDRAEHAAMP